MTAGALDGPTTGEAATPLDRSSMRELDWHEARAHAIGGRIARDLGDAILLHDPRDRDSFWNRLSGIRLPEDPGAFDARLAELFALFAGLDRRPHVWATPGCDGPVDLVERLLEHGFDDLGGGLLMALVDPDRLASVAAAVDGATLSVANRLGPQQRGPLASEIAGLLVAAFRVDPYARARLTADLLAAFDAAELHVYVVRVGGTAVAVAKRTTFDGLTYLSSIATRPGWQGRGFGSLVTAAACRDSLADGDRLTYLRVFPENARARSLYERLGFTTVGGRASDLLLGWS